MPDANSMLMDACLSGISCLNRHDAITAWAQSEGRGEMANVLLQEACANGFDCLNRKDLLVVIAQATNN